MENVLNSLLAQGPGKLGLRESVVAVASTQIGQREEPKGSNRGPMVNEYLRRVGLAPGYAWCMAFVYWCYDEAAKWQKEPNPVPRTGGVLDCWNRATAAQKILQHDACQQPALITPGAQLVLKLGKTTGHTAIVEQIDGLLIHTIEGNSNDDGSREGYEVVRHLRHMNDKALLGFIQY